LVLLLVLLVAYVRLSDGLHDQLGLRKPISLDVSLILGALAAGTVGVALSWARPRNSIGWLIAASGLAVTLSLTGEVYGPRAVVIPEEGLPLGTTTIALLGPMWIVGLVVPATLVLARYPSGRITGRRLRQIDRASWLGLLLSYVAYVTSSAPVDDILIGHASPLEISSTVSAVLGSVGALLVIAGFVGTVVDAVRRAVRDRSERMALVWLLIAVVADLSITFGFETSWLQDIAFFLVFIAIAIGVVFYGALDVVVNRALVYGGLTVLLAGTYLGTVLLLQLGLRSFTEGSSLAIAISTLGVASLFRPLRARIQQQVDRRFFRRKYDAAQTLGEFGSRVRNEVDLGDIATELKAVVVRTMQPAHATLWLRTPETGP
jgi:hypothetical protein